MPAIVFKMLLEALKVIVGKLAFAAVSERFLSRLLCHALRQLAKKSSNSFTQETCEAFIEALKRDDLPALK